MMDEKTLEALKASIRHWEENAAAEKPDDASVDAEDCALCQLDLLLPEETDACSECPIAAKTGHIDCGETPYWLANRTLEMWKAYRGKYRDAFRIAAQAEVDFLKSLLPEGEE